MKQLFKLIVLTAFIFYKPICCEAQASDSLYSTNKAANAWYIKAINCEKNSKPRTNGYTDSLEVMVHYLEKAVEGDSYFKIAWFKLAQVYDRFTFSHPNTEQYQRKAIQLQSKSKQALHKALEIESMYAQAYYLLAGITMSCDYNWDEALNYMDKAQACDSANADYFAGHALPLALKGKWKEAQRYIDKANQMAPDQSSVIRASGYYYYWKGDYLKSLNM